MQKTRNLEERKALLKRGQVLIKQGEYQQACICGQKLLAWNSDDCEALYILAMAYMNLDDYIKALAFVGKLKALDIDYIGAYMVEAHIYKRQGHVRTEIALLLQIIDHIKRLQSEQGNAVYSRSMSEAWSLLGSGYTCTGKPELALEAFLMSSKLEKNVQQSIADYSNALFVTNYIEGLPREKMWQLHLGYQKFFQEVSQYPHFVKPKKKLRVGYISPDFRQHPVAFFVYPLVTEFSSEKFEVYCYAANSADDMTQKLQGFVTKWRDIKGLDADMAAHLIYDDEVDILVDLSGHTKNNCLPILARKPAPIQISGIGYFNTTGLQAIDYFLTDKYCNPVEMKVNDFSEKLIRLPHSHFCYTPAPDMPPCTETPYKNTGHITFGSFNNFNKVTDGILRLWQQILMRVPGSRLLLKSKIFDSEEGRETVKERLIGLGFTMENIEMQGFSTDYLLQYRKLDIAFDTYPYTGGLTTCEALYMGVPVITLYGNRHGSRFGYSLLQNAGLEELIAKDAVEYVEKAVAIANDAKLLDGLHHELRQILSGSSLMNTVQYISEIEEAYQNVWQKSLLHQGKLKLTPKDDKDLRILLQQCIRAKAYRQAEAIALKLLQNREQDQEVLAILAGIYIETWQNADAERITDKILRLYSGYGYGFFLAARVDYNKDDWGKAVQKAQFALQQCSDLTSEVRSMIYNLLGNSYKNLCDSRRSVDSYLKASRYSIGMESKAVDYSNYLFNLHYLPHVSQDELYRLHKKYNDLFAGIKPYSHTRKEKHDRLKIGYISPDMRYHVVTFFSYALFKNYDKALFEVTCYAKCAEDAVSQQIAGTVDRWCNIALLNEEAAAKRIYDDGIDILFDLSGHTKNNCLPILAYKPAPVQISGIGYFDTTGLAAVDYFLADYYTDPAGENDAYFTEKLLRLPHSHFCYVPPDTMPQCTEAPCIYKGHITFGSFNNFTKTTDAMLYVWCEILHRVPGSRLLLKSKIFGTEGGCEEIKQRLKNIGFDLQKVELRPETIKYLDEYGDVDIALDTYPYPGGGTTCEALYMGVPVVTLVGKRHGARFGYSLLHNIGLDECCAFSKEDYIETAVRLASDKAHLAALHRGLREQMQASPLMDGKLYMQDLECSYLRIWQAFLQSSEPDSAELAIAVQKQVLPKVQRDLQDEDWMAVIRHVRTAQSFGEVSPEILSALAAAYFFELQDYERAVAVAKMAIVRGVRADAEMYILLGNAYRELLDYVPALQAFRQADTCLQQSINPGTEKFRGEIKKALARLQIVLGLTRDGAINYQQSSQLSTELAEQCETYSSYLLSLHYTEIDTTLLYEAHRAYDTFFTGIKRYRHKREVSKGKIKIGYISPDFRQHVMFYFYHQLLACYDKERFSVTCYSLSSLEDNFTGHLKSLVNDWQDVSAKSYADIAQRIYEDKIDVLVDLAGHSTGSGLPVLAYKPAPVQLSGIGYVDTTGLAAVDYFLTDRYVDPVGANDSCFTEKLLRLPNSQFCYTGRSDVPVSQGAPSQLKGFVVFASFNQYAKITDNILKMWLDILTHTPKSQLLLKSQVFVSPSAVSMAKERLQRIGYDMSMVLFAPATDNYMAEYLDVDIALDTYPYPGGGTTCDALYMGVPVITMYGRHHGSRFGYSILKNVGLEELAVENESAYISRAVALAGDRDLLDALHRNLREMMLKSPLMDEKNYLMQVEQLYKEIWQVYNSRCRS
jgi:predicted O-linked N-acetylglucosamine transferase (SPINDLY family)